MNILTKLRETLLSVAPIVAVVVILNFTIAPVGSAFVPFLIGAVFLVIGLSIFLTGTEIGMTPIGERLGNVLSERKSCALMLAVGFFIGFGVTFAEPDVNVLASQVHSLNPNVSEKVLVFLIATGLGIFTDIGLFRSYTNIKLRTIFTVFYFIIFAAVLFAGQSMASIAFDASGATTGPLAVPFLLALGLGVSSSRSKGEDSSFGLTGIASIGPVLAVCMMAILSPSGNSSEIAASSSDSVREGLGTVILEMTSKTARGFGPLLAMIVFLQFTLLKFTAVRFRKIAVGIVYSFVGIVLFLSGAEYGFGSVGGIIGSIISTSYHPAVSIIIAALFGAIVVCAEPAVWVLTEQVESVTAGRIKRRLVLIFMCIGVSSAVALSVVRSIFDINYLWFIYAGVGSALILSFFCPPLFVGIAFDSGGVASGPMSTTFILSFAIGVSRSAGTGFGVVGLIAIAPLIALQILGVIFRISEKRANKSIEEKGGDSVAVS